MTARRKVDQQITRALVAPARRRVMRYAPEDVCSRCRRKPSRWLFTRDGVRVCATCGNGLAGGGVWL